MPETSHCTLEKTFLWIKKFLKTARHFISIYLNTAHDIKSTVCNRNLILYIHTAEKMNEGSDALKNVDKEADRMDVKTMEGLAGAGTNMELLNTPFRVYKEARLEGDAAKMERAMGYMNDCHETICEYKKEADEGMKKDARESRKIAQEQREEAVRRRRKEREKLEEKTLENRNADISADIVEISEDGKVLLKDHKDLDHTASDGIQTDAVKEPVTYTKTGGTVPAEQEAGISVSI